MRKRVCSAVVLCCLLALMTTAPAHGQLPGSPIRAEIPFDFTVRGRTLPAGKYFIRRINDAPETLAIQGLYNHAHTMFHTEAIETRRTPRRCELVFHRYGDRYFLYRIWTPGEDTGRELPRSRAEREFTRNLAFNEDHMETVTVALF